MKRTTNDPLRSEVGPNNEKSGKSAISKRVTIEKLVAGGKGLARHQKKIYFIPFVLPGEKIEVALYKNKKDFCEAKPIQFYSTAPSRIQPFCKNFGKCGGCHFQHLNYADQLFWKNEIFREQFHRIVKSDFDFISSVQPSPEPIGYRSKIEYHLFYSEDRLQTGLIGIAPDYVVYPVDFCPLLTRSLNELVPSIIAWLNEHVPHQFLDKFLRLTVIQYSENAFFIGIEVAPKLERKMAALIDNFPATLGRQVLKLQVYSKTNNKSHRVWLDDPQKNPISITIGTLSFAMAPGSFTQVNQNQFIRILHQLASWAKESTNREELWEFYCGSGIISLSLADYFESVTGMDNDATSIACARTNAKLNHRAHCQYEAKNLEKPITSFAEGSGATKKILIVDPPRRGLSKHVMQFIEATLPDEIFYLSCDSATFSRDFSLLQTHYRPKEVMLWDMFPQTHHLEILGRFILRSSSIAKIGASL